MICTDILVIRDNYAIQRDNMTLLVVTAQQYYNGRIYANYSSATVKINQLRANIIQFKFKTRFMYS